MYQLFTMFSSSYTHLCVTLIRANTHTHSYICLVYQYTYTFMHARTHARTHTKARYHATTTNILISWHKIHAWFIFCVFFFLCSHGSHSFLTHNIVYMCAYRRAFAVLCCMDFPLYIGFFIFTVSTSSFLPYVYVRICIVYTSVCVCFCSCFIFLHRSIIFFPFSFAFSHLFYVSHFK